MDAAAHDGAATLRRREAAAARSREEVRALRARRAAVDRERWLVASGADLTADAAPAAPPKPPQPQPPPPSQMTQAERSLFGAAAAAAVASAPAAAAQAANEAAAKNQESGGRESAEISAPKVDLTAVLQPLRGLSDAEAARDAHAMQRIAELRAQGLWGGPAPPGQPAAPARRPQPEPKASKAHWDFLCDEMAWLAKDFARERQAKAAGAKRAARACAKRALAMMERGEREAREAEAGRRRLAARASRAVRQWWGDMGKVVAWRHDRAISEQKSLAMNRHLDFVVEKTLTLSREIAKDLSAADLPVPPAEGEEDQQGQQLRAADAAEPAGDAVETAGDAAEAEGERARIERAAREASEAQPTGTTLSTTRVRTRVPGLIRGELREYQQIGLDWLATMYDKGLNGILADEMGLGKTVMTIALLAHLACERRNWGPHLIVVPSSTVGNWEIELKKWCPALKVLTYIGSVRERRAKRQGWSKPDAFHVCITSYKLALQDQGVMRRRRWQYMILDEAHSIKNFRSQRWQVLLNFRTARRLLLTGTPLQNSLMELWSLMHFLMPAVFASHSEFREWFAAPISGMVEGTASVDGEIVARLHSVLRPFLLRRMKRDVERSLPPKREVVVPCALSTRQQFLYDEFINAAATQDTLVGGNFFGIVNVLMQLRKVCNHPDLFSPRPTDSAFVQLDPLVVDAPALTLGLARPVPSLLVFDSPASLLAARRSAELYERCNWAAAAKAIPFDPPLAPLLRRSSSAVIRAMSERATKTASRFLIEEISADRCYRPVLMPAEALRLCSLLCPRPPPLPEGLRRRRSDVVAELTQGFRGEFLFLHPRALAVSPELRVGRGAALAVGPAGEREEAEGRLLAAWREESAELAPIETRLQLRMPDKRLLQFDAGKLQKLAVLLRELHDGGHKVIVFTQMTKMLDVLEAFVCMHGFVYVRLDGSTRIDRRQIVIERFNRDPRIFLFLSSTRSGGFGINLTGADTVVFYDSDWNPAMDAQAQDRCHRIGQTREVTIYRLVTELTIEENILRKARQKKLLSRIAIKEGSFTTDFFQTLDLASLIQPERRAGAAEQQSALLSAASDRDLEAALVSAEDDADRRALAQAQREADPVEEFDEDTPSSSPATAAAAAAPGATPTPAATPAPAVSAAATPSAAVVSGMVAEDEMMADAVASALPQQRSAEALMAELTELQRYAVRFLEDVDPIVDRAQLDVLREELEEAQKTREQSWTFDVDALKRAATSQAVYSDDDDAAGDADEQQSAAQHTDDDDDRAASAAAEDSPPPPPSPPSPTPTPTPARRGRGGARGAAASASARGRRKRARADDSEETEPDDVDDDDDDEFVVRRRQSPARGRGGRKRGGSSVGTPTPSKRGRRSSRLQALHEAEAEAEAEAAEANEAGEAGEEAEGKAGAGTSSLVPGAAAAAAATGGAKGPSEWGFPPPMRQ
eukprot:m51a1_g1758 putative serine threonine protein kinase (1447) ;mRNA; r:252438-256948